ncbi:Adipokinetic hormone/corazonin-related peptide receptor variant [Dirofilaria immitis]
MFLILIRNQRVKNRRVHTLLLRMNIAHLIVLLIYMPNEVIHSITVTWASLFRTSNHLCEKWFTEILDAETTTHLTIFESNSKSVNTSTMKLQSFTETYTCAKNRTLKMTLVAVSAFLLCWTPYAVASLIHLAMKSSVVAFEREEVSVPDSAVHRIEIYFGTRLITEITQFASNP